MRASIDTLVSLEQFAQVLGLDPLHFAGADSSLRPQAAHCHDIWYQYQWQDSGKASREEVARALHRAEEELANILGYWPAWKWIEDERHKLGRGGQTPHIERPRLVTRWKHVISGGAQAVAAIEATDVTRGANIDPDGDGFAEMAVFTIANVETTWDLEEIKACFKVYSAGDAANTRTNPSSSSYDEAWEVRPLRLVRSGTTVTAYIPVWHLFRPQLYEELNPDIIDADTAGNYVDTLSFYRVYNDLSTQVSFMWGTDCVYDVSCAWDVQAGCMRTPDPRNGIITVVPGTYDADDDEYTATRWTYQAVPDAARLWYRAGLERPAPGMVDYTMARLIVMLACARLSWPVCTCSNVKALVDEWKENAAKVTEQRTYTMPLETLMNPLGTRVGEILVWQGLKIPARRIGRAVRT